MLVQRLKRILMLMLKLEKIGQLQKGLAVADCDDEDLTVSFYFYFSLFS